MDTFDLNLIAKARETIWENIDFAEEAHSQEAKDMIEWIAWMKSKRDRYRD